MLAPFETKQLLAKENHQNN